MSSYFETPFKILATDVPSSHRLEDVLFEESSVVLEDLCSFFVKGIIGVGFLKYNKYENVSKASFGID